MAVMLPPLLLHQSKMADFGILSDTDDSAVDELISQIQELSVLEQVSKINTCSFSDSPLPSHLDSRFQRLKSLPNPTNFKDRHLNPESKSIPNDVSAGDPLNSSTAEAAEEAPNVKEDPFLLSPNSSQKRGSKLESRSFDSPSDSSVSSMDSPSPPKRSGCFWCSPKKEVESKKKKNKVKTNFDWGKGGNEEYWSAMSSFSVKEQEKILKKAVKEEERINREADKIVKWAKQASQKLNSRSYDEFSDDDDDGNAKYL